jgi:aspartyl-tRNA(Asn)/glutamyl-tRNA(Gln) amidotransferase subunit A
VTVTIEEFGRRLRAGQITAAEATEQCLRRIEADTRRLNAYILVMSEEARAQARSADRELAAGLDRGPLHGVPISIKDLLDVGGVPTTAASRVREGHVAARDAAAIANLRQAGAVFIGKTNLHEFAFGTTNEDSAFGPARNPYDPARSPGGSSGGSAASVVAGMALASIGTDTGGSIRIPAAACGLVGLKPTRGEVSIDGVVPLSHTLDHVGPITRSVTDAWLVHRALLGEHSTASADLPRRAPASALRLGWLRPYFCDFLDEEVRARFEASLARLRQAGVRIDEADVPHATEIASTYLAIVLIEAGAYHAATLQSMPERYTAPVRERLEMAKSVSADDYARALTSRKVLTRDVTAALTDHDALVLPTLPIPAPPLGIGTIRIDRHDEPVRSLMLRSTQLFNLTGHPAISLPCGYTSLGLPCGLQLVGAHGRTQALLEVALACEPYCKG